MWLNFVVAHVESTLSREDKKRVRLFIPNIYYNSNTVAQYIHDRGAALILERRFCDSSDKVLLALRYNLSMCFLSLS
jgi:hypothetical protein